MIPIRLVANSPKTIFYSGLQESHIKEALCHSQGTDESQTSPVIPSEKAADVLPQSTHPLNIQKEIFFLVADDANGLSEVQTAPTEVWQCERHKCTRLTR